MDERQPTANLVAITGNRISAVLTAGPKDIQRLSLSKRTKVIDCQGKILIPGFNDAHCHVLSFARQLLSIDLGPSSVSSIKDIQSVVREKIKKLPLGQWVRGTGFNEYYLKEGRFPNRWELDEVSPQHPVILVHSSLHACVLNSLALSCVGITGETTEPPGAVIDRDHNSGEPNGILFEMLAYIMKRCTNLQVKDFEEGIRQANEYYLSNGITSLQELTISNDLDRWLTYQRLKLNDKLQPRLSVMVGVQALDEFRESGINLKTNNQHLRFGGVKIIVTENKGEIYPEFGELKRQIGTVNQSGLQLCAHAIEESAIGIIVNILEHTSDKFSITGRRYRIEHCAECPPYLLSKLQQLGVIIVTQPPFVYFNGDRYLATVPQQQQSWLYRIKSFLERGLVVAGSSDSPVVPNNPFFGIYAAVNRQTETGRYLLTDEAIGIHQAIKLYTTNAAYATFEENLKGSLSPGKLADIVMLDDDPMEVSSEVIKDIKVLMTMIDGQVVWQC